MEETCIHKILVLFLFTLYVFYEEKLHNACTIQSTPAYDITPLVIFL